MYPFYEQLMKYYFNLELSPNYHELGKVDKYISWYLADAKNELVTIKSINNYKYILDIDITSAFPTICNNVFKNIHDDFLNQMNSYTDKKEKNIFIATSLKESGWLKTINIICKIIILSIINSCPNRDEVLILEIKKDGATIVCNDENYYYFQNITENASHEIIKFILNSEFKFHTKEYSRYLRENKTSYFLDTDNILDIKGIYKHMPEYISNKILDIYSGINLLNIDEILYIYSNIYFQTISTNNVIELINKYYICNNKKILNHKGKYDTYKRNININPNIYLQIFIFPVILANKLD